jgi:hypothetical protein
LKLATLRSIAFEELGLAEQTMLVAFGIVFGALMLGLAIAFGMGAECASPHSKTHQEQCILKSSLTSGSNFSVGLMARRAGLLRNLWCANIPSDL